MSNDLIEKSKQVLANIEFNDTTYEVARDVVLDEIERLNNQIKEYGDLDNHNKYLYEENKRLNNIINELEKYIEIKMKDFGVCNASDIYYKLQELKGSDKQ